MKLFTDHTLGELRDMADLTVAVAACHAAGLFEALADRPATPEELAERLGYDARAVRIALLAMEEAGLLERRGGRLAPTPACRRRLCEPEDPDYAAGGLAHWLSSIRDRTRLDEVIRRGGPVEKGEKEWDEERVARFMSAMAAAPDERVRRIVDLCLDRHPDPRSLLDVGGGPGHMSRVFVNRGLTAVLFDAESVVGHVAEAYNLAGMEGLELVAGDFTTDPLPEGPFDIVLLSNVLHIYPPDTNRRVLGEAARVAAPGGVVAVAEFLRGHSGRAARFGVQMLLKTDGGDAYSAEEVGAWLEEAGFEGARVDDIDEDRQLVTAKRAPV